MNNDVPVGPTWMPRPSGPGLWACIGGQQLKGRELLLTLTADDLARGAPFYVAAVFGPIPEPPKNFEGSR